MQFKIQLKDSSRNNLWWEYYNERSVTTEDLARDWVLRNMGLLGVSYEIVQTVFEPNSVPLEHIWVKTNFFTLRTAKGDSYDAYRCSHCKAKAKRVGVGEIIPDKRVKHFSCID